MPNPTNLRRLRRVITSVQDDLLHMRSVSESSDCGTARCALGWAEVDPVLGPKLSRLDGGSDSLYWGAKLHAGMELFGLSAADAEFLFAHNVAGISAHAISKAEVLWNIDELLAGRAALPYRAIVEYDHVHYRDSDYGQYEGPCAAGL